MQEYGLKIFNIDKGIICIDYVDEYKDPAGLF